MRTQSHVCENPISAFCDRGLHDLVILVSRNAYYVYIQNSFLCLVIYPWHYSLTGSAVMIMDIRNKSKLPLLILAKNMPRGISKRQLEHLVCNIETECFMKYTHAHTDYL